MQTNPAVEQNKNVNGQTIRGISAVGEEKVYGVKGFIQEPPIIHSFIHSFILNQATWPIDSSNTIKSETDYDRNIRPTLK